MQKGRRGAEWAYEKFLELPGAAEARSFFQEGCPMNQLNLSPHQQAQARLSTGTRALGLSSTDSNRKPASIGSRVQTLPEVIAYLAGPLGDQVRRGFPDSNIIAQLGCSLRETRDTWGVTNEAVAGIIPESWWEWGLCRGGPCLNGPRGRQAGRTTPSPIIGNPTEVRRAG